MHRGNYKSIGNNFISGGVYNNNNPHPSAQRQTRSNNVATGSPAPVATSNLIKVETQPLASTTSSALEAIAAVVSSPMQIEAVDINPARDDLTKIKNINFKKKVSGKEKRVKQNKKLYRMLTPRNAIAALNELTVGQSVGETVVVPISGNKFEAEVILANVAYKGSGSSKMQAKNSACEKALRDLVINKFRLMKQQEATAPSTSCTTGSNEDVTMDEADSNDVPMLQLASFALHKLFAEWEAEGFEIPLPKANENAALPQAGTSEGAVKPPTIPKPPKVKTELPPNNLTMHPVMLLSIMRPCTQYNDLGSQGVTPNIMHTVGATVSSQSFIGQGRSKKEARKRVATTILQKLFDWQGTCT